MAAIDRWIHHWADHRPTHLAVWFEGRATTYAELSAAIHDMAQFLRARSVTAGDRVAFCGLNRVEQISLLFACARLGAVLVPLNNRLSVAEHRFQIEDCSPVLALVTDGFGSQLASAAPALRVVDLDDDPVPTAPVQAPSVGEGDDRLLLVYTSGTTGWPKGAVHSQSSLLFTVLNGVAHQDLVAADRVLTSLPLFHVGGLNIQTLPALYVGASVFLQRRFDPDEAFAIVRDHRPTQSLVVPATLRAFLDHPGFASTDISCLRGLNSGSSVVPEHLIRAVVDRGVPVGQVYGSTETGPTAVVLRYEDCVDHLASCGKPALHTELRVVDADGRDVVGDTAGFLLVRGPHLFVEYWNRPQETAAAFVDGWYDTGDIGCCDADGYVFIKDRAKDMLISGGENVYPAEVENALIAHPAVAEVAVVGRGDPMWGEVPVAVIVLAAGAEVLKVEDLRSWCSGRLARYKQPREVILTDSLPRTALGKVTKHILRDEFDLG